MSDDPNMVAKLREAFLHGLDLSPETDVNELAFGRHPHWDSLGHMTLVMVIEERLGVTLDGDEVMRLDSFAEAIAILGARHPLS